MSKHFTEDWICPPAPNEIPKVTKIKQLLLRSSEDIEPFTTKEKTWFHYYRKAENLSDKGSFGFSVMDGVVIDCDEPGWKGKEISIEKLERLKNEGKITEIPIKQIVL